MQPPKNNTLEADVAFYLFHLSQPKLAIDLCPALLKELIETYGEANVSTEIERQRNN